MYETIMDETISASVYLGDPRLTAHAASATAVWLWTADGSRLLWANPAGCAALGAATPQALLARRFVISDPARGHIERLAESLPEEGGARLFRLRGFAGAAWTSLTCSCARLEFGSTPGVLVVATEPVGAELPLAERVRLLGFAEDDAVAAFSPNGTQLFATTVAERRLAGAAGLGAIDATALATAALATGGAQGTSGVGPVVLQRIGRGTSTVLLARFFDPVTAVVGEIEPATAEPVAVEPAVVEPAVVEPAVVEPTRVEPPEIEPLKIESPQADLPEVEPALFEPKVQPERRHPLRFVWQMDAAGRFFLDSDEFADLLGGAAQHMSGRPWSELSAEFAIDPEGRVARAVASRETWSNILVSWPAEGDSERLTAELSGLPAFDRNRAFRGYRGFGVCRDVSHVERLAGRRRAAAAVDPLAPVGPTEAGPVPTKEIAPAVSRIAPNVVRFPGTPPLSEVRGALEAESSALGSGEHGAFHELARQLTVRLQATELAPVEPVEPGSSVPEPPAQLAVMAPASFEPPFMAHASMAHVSVERAAAEPPRVEQPRMEPPRLEPAEPPPASPAGLPGTASSGRLAPAVQAPPRGAEDGDDARPVLASDESALLDRMPVGILVYRYEELLFANRMALAWTGHADLSALRAAGGLEALFPDAGLGALAPSAGDGRRLSLASRGGEPTPVEARLFAIHWDGEPAFATLLFKSAADERLRSVEGAVGQAKALAWEFEALLDRVEDAVLLVDRVGAILSIHGGGKAFLGQGGRPLVGASFEILFAPDARAGAAAQLGAVVRDGGSLSAERIALGGNGELRPMMVTIAPLGAGARAERMSVVLRDTAAARGPERDLTAPGASALDVAAALGRLCHEARSPITAIVGFCDIMLDEAFGPVGPSRYREYVRDIKKSGAEVMSRLVEAVELVEVMTGTAALSPVPVSLNEIVNLCVAAQQDAASTARVVIRTALSTALTPILADATAVKSMVLNLLGHALGTTPAGGQVIVSTGRSPAGDTVLRIRDSGEGLNEKAIEAALNGAPRRPPDPRDASTWETGTRGAGLALVQGLAEANHAEFTITSKPHQGSLFEVVFPAKPERSSSERSSSERSSSERSSTARPSALADVTARPVDDVSARPVDGAR
jgi:signal transduction histidine kinase